MEQQYERISPQQILNETFRSKELLAVKDKHKMMGRKTMDVVVLNEAMGKIAERKKEESGGYETPEILQFELAQSLPAFLGSQHKLDLNREHKEKYDRYLMSLEEKNQALGDVVKVNHIVRELIESETYRNINQFTQFAANYFMSFNEPKEMIGYAESSMRKVAQGMRHEIAAQSVLNSLPDVYEASECTTVEDESKGRDLKVNYKGVELYLDIKASEWSAEKANAKNARAGYTNDTIVVWSGFGPDDIGDLTIPPDDVLESKKKHFVDILNGLVPSEQEQREAS